MPVTYSVTNSNDPPPVPGWLPTWTIGRWNLFHPWSGPFGWAQFQPALFQTECQKADAAPPDAPVLLDIEHALIPHPEHQGGQPGLAYKKLPDARVYMAAHCELAAMFARRLPGRKLFVYGLPTAVEFSLTVNAAIVDGVIVAGTPAAHGGTFASATAYVDKWRQDVEWEWAWLRQAGVTGLAPQLYYVENIDHAEAFVRVAGAVCRKIAPTLFYFAPFQGGAGARLPDGWLTRLVAAAHSVGCDAGVWREHTGRDKDWVGEFAKPDPPPPPPPPPIDVGDTPPPAELRVAKGEPASKIQKLLDAKGRAFLERGGVYAGSFRVSGSTAPECGLFAYGTGPRPVVKVPKQGRGLAVTGGKAVAVRGVEFVADGKHDQGRSHGLYFDGKIAVVTIADVKVWGFNQNVAFQADGDFGEVSIVRLVSTHAQGAPSDVFAGQPLFLAGCKGRPTVSRCVLCRAGRRYDDAVPTTYNHAIYAQKNSAAPIVTDCILCDNAFAGIQSRQGLRAKGNFTGWNAMHYYAVGGGVSIEDFAIVGGTRYWTGSSWAGNAAMGIITAAHLFRGVIVGTPEQAAAQTKSPKGQAAKSFDLGCFQLSKDYKPHPEWSEGASIETLDDVTVADNWPGKLVTGDAADRLDPARLRRAKVASAATAEIRKLVDAATAGDASVTAGKLIALARGAVGL